jgi:hypothetical protein
LPDLNPYNYFLWRFLKGNVYRNNPHVNEQQKGAISAAAESITEGTLAADMENHR